MTVHMHTLQGLVYVQYYLKLLFVHIYVSNNLILCTQICCTDVSDKAAMSPLHCACLGGHKDVVEYLVEKANCDVSEYLKLLFVHIYVSNNLILCTQLCYTDVSDENDRSPLHCACLGGHKDVVEYLVEKANCDVSEYLKLLFVHIKFYVSNNFILCTQLCCTDVSNKDAMSPLHSACLRGHKDVVEYLVEKANCDVSE